MSRDKHAKKGAPKKASVVLSQLREDVRSLSSSILIIGQKMKYLVRNEKILGRNLIVLNKKLKSFEEKVASGELGGKGKGAEISAETLKNLEGMESRINTLQAELASIKHGVASQEQLQELKYVIDSINPLELATLQQVKDLIDEKIAKKKK
ncbi:MAG: hypothetical protein CL943_01995 [Candidatus Diapherotrites archaeon]|uniref:Uncharacterized protein n=1 Tax=Candidatus Iainarchaeum sp. TaxID=3101447 RepID=A0A2D6M0V1_9ARCH|nr:hypothetical protein [Candidatus Diapherotrites archaeon]|tara:strand:+ start:8825 stop:9280 length:456 start_codon:yes stop_codon:yes gene_type:complete